MRLPSAETIGLFYAASETALGLLKRSGNRVSELDRSSLRVLWITIVLSVAAAITASRVLPQFGSASMSRAYPLGVGLFVAGLGLRWMSIIHLGRLFTVDVAIAKDHRLVDSGPYRFVRHPSYSGALLAFAGFGICLGNWISLLVLIVPIGWAFLRRIQIEESALIRALGDDYAAYARRTRRLVPFVY